MMVTWWLLSLALQNPVLLGRSRYHAEPTSSTTRRQDGTAAASIHAPLSRRCLVSLALSTPSSNEILDQQDPFQLSMNELGFLDQHVACILSALVECGLYDDSNDAASQGRASQTLQFVAQDFCDRPEVLSACLQTDFGLKPLVAHQTRAAILHALRRQGQPEERAAVVATPETTVTSTRKSSRVNGDVATDRITNAVAMPIGDLVGPNGADAANKAELELQLETDPSATDKEDDGGTSTLERRPLYKSIVVNKPAKQRKTKAGATRDYGLPRDYGKQYPQLAIEMDEFMTYMTRPSTDSQEDPIRPATATVYLRHAKLFLGWYVNEYLIDSTASEKQALSVFSIIKTKEKDSANSILEFLLWLRSARQISVSYEANFLRGLTKLIKYRFAKESQTDPKYGEKSFDDIPLIRELRKWHRDADKKRTVAPRSSDETQKWLSWPEYLQVVSQCRDDLESMLRSYEEDDDISVKRKDETYTPQQRKIAVAFQKYLVLAFFSNIPDRQRTIRELELNRSFVEDGTGCWCIKHRPDDYKTGKTYGERPPLQMSASLTPAIDNFLKRWRPCLLPVGDYFFVQPRTGNPLTRDSVYQIVGRSCYQYSGKRTNPHLLRDMIVTHVRESSDASEKELEALALFMGHSVQMQRTSYDRRTLDQKVAPAVQLLESVNSKISVD